MSPPKSNQNGVPGSRQGDPPCGVSSDHNGRVTVCVVFYGPYPELCRRFLVRLYQHTPVRDFSLRVGLNAACQETVELVESAAREFGNVLVHDEPRNIYKSPLMGKLFALRPVETDWLVWFDDDSHPYRPDWLAGLRLKQERQPAIDVWGNLFHTEADDAAVRFIETASWYRGMPFNHHKPGGEWSARPVLTFVEGGFWAVRTSVLHTLQWPDPRLVQNEDDYIFGEALRQNGFQIGRYRSGVRISHADRRCPRDTPCSYDQPVPVEVSGAHGTRAG